MLVYYLILFIKLKSSLAALVIYELLIVLTLIIVFKKVIVRTAGRARVLILLRLPVPVPLGTAATTTLLRLTLLAQTLLNNLAPLVMTLPGRTWDRWGLLW